MAEGLLGLSILRLRKLRKSLQGSPVCGADGGTRREEERGSSELIDGKKEWKQTKERAKYLTVNHDPTNAACECEVDVVHQTVTLP